MYNAVHGVLLLNVSTRLSLLSRSDKISDNAWIRLFGTAHKLRLSLTKAAVLGRDSTRDDVESTNSSGDDDQYGEVTRRRKHTRRVSCSVDSLPDCCLYIDCSGDRTGWRKLETGH